MAGLPGVGGGSPGFAEKAQRGFAFAANTYSKQRKITDSGEKTAGGAIMSSASMAASGAMVGSVLAGATAGSALPGIGTAVGAVAGLAGYLFS